MTAAGPENVPTTDLSDLPGRYGTASPAPIPAGCVRITVEDDQGAPEVSIVGPDDYAVIAVGDCHVANLQAFGNGTHVLTVKGRR